MIIKKTTGEQIDIDCNTSIKIKHLKKAIQDVTGVPAKYQCLQYKGEHLGKRNAKLESYGITENDQVDLQVALSGGCYESCGCCGCGESCGCEII